MQRMNFFIADLIACSTRFGQHYAHHQELESILQVVAMLHLVGILFPHIIDDARSESHQTDILYTINVFLSTVTFVK